MSQPITATSSAFAAAAPESLLARSYKLSSELAQFCLPAAARDENKKYAWANSICFLFLLIGLIGLKTPKIVVKQVAPATEVVPVVFTPPPEQRKTEPKPQEQPEETPEPTLDQPQVATVVAADPAAVAFAVPVEGPVLLSPSARFVPPPPVNPPKAAPNPIEFRPGAGTPGVHPPPRYPPQALEQRMEGEVTLYVMADPNGLPLSVEVHASSGYSLLDRSAADHVKRRWQFPPTGTNVLYQVPIEFRLQR